MNNDATENFKNELEFWFYAEGDKSPPAWWIGVLRSWHLHTNHNVPTNHAVDLSDFPGDNGSGT